MDEKLENVETVETEQPAPKKRRGRPKKEESLDEIREDIKENNEEIKEDLHEIADVSKEEFHEIKDSAENIAVVVEENVPEIAEDVKQVVEDKVEEVKQDIEVKKSSKKVSKTNVYELAFPTPLYIAKNHAQAKAKITGIVQVISEDDSWQEVIATIKGFGKVHGYIRK